MAHFAKIENGIVTQVVVVDNAHEADGERYLISLGLHGNWVQTSYNANFRGKFAAIGDTYNKELDIFEPTIAVEPDVIQIDPIAIESSTTVSPEPVTPKITPEIVE